MTQRSPRSDMSSPRILFALSVLVATALVVAGPLASAHTEPPLDMTKTLILPNFRMFSDIAHIFYHPHTGHPIPLTYSKEIPGTDLLTKGFGLIPCECHRDALYCACCVYVSIQRFNFQRTACSNLTVQTESLELDLTIDYSGYTLANRSLSLRHPPPFCIPTPQIPALLSCVRVHDITVKNGVIEFCINFEIKVVAIPNPVFILEFTCVNYGPDGLIIERPTTYHHMHGNSQPQGSVNWNAINHLATSTTEGVLEIEVSSTPRPTEPPEPMIPESPQEPETQPTDAQPEPASSKPTEENPSEPNPIDKPAGSNQKGSEPTATGQNAGYKGNQGKPTNEKVPDKGVENPSGGLLFQNENVDTPDNRPNRYQIESEQAIETGLDEYTKPGLNTQDSPGKKPSKISMMGAQTSRPNRFSQPDRVDIVSLDVADDPSKKRSGGYLMYNRRRRN